jgi:hypothetical protein
MAELTFRNRFSQMILFILTGNLPIAPMTKHLTIAEGQHFTLPREVTSLRVLAGKAWISHMGKDTVLYRGEAMQIEPRRDIAILTSLGHKSVELELNS